MYGLYSDDNSKRNGGRDIVIILGVHVIQGKFRRFLVVPEGSKIRKLKFLKTSRGGTRGLRRIGFPSLSVCVMKSIVYKKGSTGRIP